MFRDVMKRYGRADAFLMMPVDWAPHESAKRMENG
jgi:hypothetical protein